MAITLYYHPLSSFCHKVLIAFYENDTPFERYIVEFMNEACEAELKRVWPIARFPVLRDEARDKTIPESSIIIEYVEQHFPVKTRLIPSDPELALEVRARDRFFDLYVNVPMQKIVTDNLRPAGKNDELGVEQAKTQLRIALDLAEKDMKRKTWAVGDVFTMADCAAAPGLFYANMVMPFEESHPSLAAYSDRLQRRASYARVLEEAQPYMKNFPA